MVKICRPTQPYRFYNPLTKKTGNLLVYCKRACMECVLAGYLTFNLMPGF